ncbi:toxin Doc [Streptomyces polyrhachis]|uniref:Toxin Doc n=1 Tax=Streptomyces polyrhachis TaxID=1282885 RepID=A0ABW2GIA5_9ACTN
MNPALHIDIRWLLERQAAVVPEGKGEVADYSALVAAVARHRVDPPRFGYDPDPAWRAAALLTTLVNERPLPAHNELYGCYCALSYLEQCGEGIDAPYGALIDLCREVRTGGADVFTAADRLRGWRI